MGHAYLSFTAVRSVLPAAAAAASSSEVQFKLKSLFLPDLGLAGGEASLWDITMNSSTQGPTLEHLQKVVYLKQEKLFFE